MNIEVMKQALEALEMLAKWEHPASNITTKSGRIYPHHVAKNAAATLRLAIEQAEKQEPVAWQWLDTGTFRKKLPKDAEPGAWRALYTAPPQRQPLTEEEIVEIAWDWKSGGPIDFARAIERKHGIGGGE